MIDNNTLQFIRLCTGRRTLLEALAEESNELGQAALKVIRSQGLNENPTPIKEDEALQNLSEEIVDVMILLHVLGYDLELAFAEMKVSPKWDRWVQRLSEGGVK